MTTRFLDTVRLNHEAEMESKAKAVQSALLYKAVTYKRHESDAGLTPNMAQFYDNQGVEFWSIIWHRGAFCYGEPDTVEVRAPDGEIYGHMKIANLRKFIDEWKSQP